MDRLRRSAAATATNETQNTLKNEGRNMTEKRALREIQKEKKTIMPEYNLDSTTTGRVGVGCWLAGRSVGRSVGWLLGRSDGCQ